MRKFILFIAVIWVFISCQEIENNDILTPIINLEIDDSDYILNKKFSKGDSRRYGLFPNRVVSQKELLNIITLAERGLPITFISGRYDTDMTLNKVSNVNFIFKNVILNGSINITNGSNKIKLGGKLTVLDKVFIKESANIIFDTLLVESDTIKNKYNKKNRGVSIYAGSKNIKFKSLKIVDTGGDSDDFYTHSAAALQIHGWNNNPENIQINSLEINNSARTALYITGANHKIKKVDITNFGTGSAKNMFGLEDAKPKEETEFTGLWMNKCDNCEIDSLSIDNTKLGATYSLRLDEGVYHKPSFINNINFKNEAIEMTIKDNILTNILVKNEY